MSKVIEKIEKQIASLQSKIDALSGTYLTNTRKRQREQQERDRRKEVFRVQIEVLQYLKEQAANYSLTPFEQNLAVTAFYEDMRCFSASKKYCEGSSYNTFSYPKSDDDRVKRLQKAEIYNTEQLIEAVERFDAILQAASTPPDKDAIRLRDLLYKAQLYQHGDIQFTPSELAEELISLAGIDADSRVLEPEAGTGNIADVAKRVTEQVDCIERMVEFREILQLKKHRLISDDLLDAEAEPVYDAVIMNPPFSEECEHVRKAFDFVRPGGNLVAICSNSIEWKTTRKYEQFREWLAGHPYRFTKPQNGKFEMTGVHTVILVMTKAA